MLRLTVLRVVCFLTLIRPVCCTGAQREPLDRFVTEAPRAWERYRRLLCEIAVQGTIAYRETDLRSGQSLGSFRSQFKIKDGLVVVVRTQRFDGVRTRRIAYGANRDYAFYLRYSEPAEAWAISWMNEHDPEKAPAWYGGRSFADVLRRSLGRGLIPMSEGTGLDVARSLSEGRLQPLSGRVSSKGLVEIEFTYKPLAGESVLVDRAILTFDPSQYWLVTKGVSIVRWLTGEEGEILFRGRYRNFEGGVPLPLRIEEQVCAAAGGGERGDRHGARLGDGDRWSVNRLKVMEYTVQPLRTRDDTEFRLTAFGLPEPKARGTRTARRWLFFRLIT